MTIYLEKDTECRICGEPGDTRTVTVQSGRYRVRGIQGTDYRIKTFVYGGGFVDVLAKFEDARECGGST